MTRCFFTISILTALIACKSGGHKSKVEASSDADKTIKTKGIHLGVKGHRIDTLQQIIEVDATLYNYNNDTAYYLTSTCEGEQYSLRYDTAKFELTPFTVCNASFPKLGNIFPKGQYNFQTHFRCKDTVTSIKIGFDFYATDKSVDLTNKNLGDLHIFIRPETQQTIVWANDTPIR